MSNSCFRLKLEPLEPFFFGGERTFNFGEEKQQYRNKYYISSENLPSQTTLLGMLRFVLLNSEHLITNDYCLSESAQRLVGSKSFSFNASQNSFGCIEKVHPLFLLDRDNNYLIKTPYNHNYNAGNIKFTPYAMTDVSAAADADSVVILSKEISSIPADFNPKIGIKESFTRLNDGTIFAEDKLIFSHEQIGIRTHQSGGGNYNSFYKKEYKLLQKGYAFACFVELNQIPEQFAASLPLQTIVYLGQAKSAFRLSVTAAYNDLTEKISNAFIGCGQSFYYALSDIKLPNQATSVSQYNMSYWITDYKPFRNLETNHNEKKYYKKLKKSAIIYLLKAGSVFYAASEPDFKNNADCQKVGFNQLIKIGGEK